MTKDSKTTHGSTALAELFFRGAFRDILLQTIESQTGKFSKDVAAYVVGALAFSGRIDDALVIFEKYEEDMNANAIATCRFTLAIGLVRVSRYDDGVRFLIANLQSLRSEKIPKKIPEKISDMARFYIWQGVAFFRFFQCRYQCSLKAARKSWAPALKANFKFGQAVAADLRAHALLSTGQIASGLKSFDDALRLSKTLGNGALYDNIRSSISYYRAAHGLDGNDTVANLKTMVAGFDPQDNFSLAAAQTALAHQLTLRGDLNGSEELLQKAARVILVASHTRQKTALLHKYAYNRYLMGRFAEADDFLDKAQATLDSRFDLVNILRVLGLRHKLLSIANSNNSGVLAELNTDITRLTKRTGYGIGRNILWRRTGENTPTLAGDDPLGDLKHRGRQGDETSYADISRLLEAGMFGFLHEIMPFPVGSRVICLDLIPGEIFIFDRGNVSRSGEGVSTILKTFALALGKSGRSKKDLVELVWGYQYHSLRHDPLLYALVNRMRQALGRYTDWLIADSGGYAWDESVSVVVYEHREIISRQINSRSPRNISTQQSNYDDSGETSNLNHRQLIILSELQKRDFLNALECAKINEVSKVTATRDLTKLTELKLIKRFGKGRATHYSIGLLNGGIQK